MRFNDVLFSLAVLSIIACTKVSSVSNNQTCSNPVATPPPPTSSPTGSNVMPVTVDGTLCNASTQYPNELCTEVTICQHGSTTNCVQLTDILLDTGSSGLRVFSTTVSSLSLPPVTAGGNDLADCVSYADGSSDWGQVVTADIQLGGETASNIPIQLINSSYASPPTGCNGQNGDIPDTSPQEAGFNGILGVSQLQYDCGGDCTTDSGNGQYFTCNGSSCTPSTAQLAEQVQNPVPSLPVDNNGILLQLPSVAAAGQPEASGYAILGIGTKPNNTPPSGVTTYGADANGNFLTQFDAVSSGLITGFIDSGSSDLSFSSPGSGSLPGCNSSSIANGFFCPSSTVSFTALTIGATRSPSGCVPFEIANALTLFNNASNNVFSNLGSPFNSAGFFDWGLPFFYGRVVYIGFDTTASTPLGSGPFWAY